MIYLSHIISGSKLPSLSNPGTASDLLSGKQLINENGEIVIGSIPSQSGTTIIPGTSQKTACASGRYTTGNIYVAGDSNLLAKNIAKGVKIFGVTGTHVPASETVTVTFPGRMDQVVYVDADGNSTWGEGKTFNVLKGGVIIFDSAAYRITFSPSNAATLVDKQEITSWGNFRYVYMINDNCTVSY